MKGIMFNALENFISTQYGEETLEEIMEKSKLITQAPFVGPGTYPDEDFQAIISETVNTLSLDKGELMRTFGRFTFTEFRTRFPQFLQSFDHPAAFLKTVESIIHVEVRKLMEDAYLPTFQYKEPAERELIITYFSKRKMYKLMEGIIEGVAEHFGIGIHQTQVIYQKEGQEYCDFHLRFDR
jgi:hypothetical protein